MELALVLWYLLYVRMALSRFSLTFNTSMLLSRICRRFLNIEFYALNFCYIWVFDYLNWRNCYFMYFQLSYDISRWVMADGPEACYGGCDGWCDDWFRLTLLALFDIFYCSCRFFYSSDTMYSCFFMSSFSFCCFSLSESLSIFLTRAN